MLCVNYILVELGKKKRMLLSSRTFYSHLLGNMTNLDSIFKSRDIILPTKVHLVKAMVFPVVMYDVRAGLWRRLNAEELMLLSCGVGEDSWESLGLQGDPTSPSWRRSVLSVHCKDWCWSWHNWATEVMFVYRESL